MRPQTARHLFSGQVWTGVISDLLVRFYLWSVPLTSADYLTFFKSYDQTHVTLCHNVSEHQMWFQYDWAPPD
ncbi:hypothetical protein TNCV_331261 [Trichonephila clavipes]|nr:hypothetical protein TNCV_331261 [Trichonephila clavipes]